MYLSDLVVVLSCDSQLFRFPKGVPWVRYHGIYRDLQINVIWPGKDQVLGKYMVLLFYFILLLIQIIGCILCQLYDYSLLYLFFYRQIRMHTCEKLNIPEIYM